MRPKILEIEGLQSFREMQKVDFDSLAETGLFGIFGPTGSGKSTVLDAITFALYGRVKRADGGTQGIINTGQKIARVSFSFELSKDGARRHFRVERVYQRKKGAANSCEAKVARLIEVTAAGEVPLSDKVTEVTGKIRDLLGLSHEDFTRAVVLPQNSFQEFLLLSNADRRGMLERIFYLEEYGRELSDKLKRKLEGIKSRLDLLTGERKGYEEASAEAVDMAKQELTAIEAERERQERDWVVVERHFFEAREVWGLVQEAMQVAANQSAHREQLPLIERQRERLRQATAAEELRGPVGQLRELQDQLRETRGEWERITFLRERAQVGLEEDRRLRQNLQAELATEKPRLTAHRLRLLDAQVVGGEMRGLTQQLADLQTTAAEQNSLVANRQRELEAAVQELFNQETVLTQLQQEMDSLLIDPDYRREVQAAAVLEKEVLGARSRVDQLAAGVASQRQSMEAAAPRLQTLREEMKAMGQELTRLAIVQRGQQERQPVERSVLQAQQERLYGWQRLWDVLEVRLAGLVVMADQITEQRRILATLTPRRLAQEVGRENAEDFAQQCRQELDVALRERDASAACVLARQLQPGEACPVCGSPEHPHLATVTPGLDFGLLEKQVEEAREKLTVAEKALREAESEVLVVREREKSLQVRLLELTQAQEEKKAAYGEECRGLPAEWQDQETSVIRASLGAAIQVQTGLMQALTDWEEENAAQEIQKQQMEKRLAGLQLQENSLAVEWTVNREQLAQRELELAHSQSEAVEWQQKYAEFTGRYLIHSAIAELDALAERDRHLQERQTKLQVGRTRRESLQSRLDQARETLHAARNEAVKQEVAVTSLRESLQAFSRKRRELAGDADVDQEIQRIDQQLQEYDAQETILQNRLAIWEDEERNFASHQATLAGQRDIYEANGAVLTERLEKSLQTAGFSNPELAATALLPERERTGLRQEIADYEQTSMNLQGQGDLLQRRLQGRHITAEIWEESCSRHQERAAAKEAAISQSEVARSHFARLQVKHSKWLELEASQRELSHKQGLLEQIQKLLRAEHRKDNSFIDYIAEERLGYVAAKASETLGVMTKYKYALELDADAGFIIRDNANGGVHRRVASLSGGETFLTALALALALSEQIQLKGQSPLEFFFLDEGFGTLDNQLLDTVVDSLERLSCQERIIGLISHVPELRSRITRRLIIEPPQISGAGSRVRIEKA